MEHHLRERVALLEAIGMTTDQSTQAIADRDLDALRTLGGERERLFTALRAVDRALALCEGPVGRTPVGRALHERAQELLRNLVPAEAALRAQLAHWRHETGAELRGMRRSQGARRAYAATERAR